MPKRINWNEMYDDLKETLKKVRKEIKAKKINVRLTIGKEPPRIYVRFNRPEELSDLTESAEDSQIHAESCIAIGILAREVSRVMKEKGLISYPSPSRQFTGPDHNTNIYGYNHKDYEI